MFDFLLDTANLQTDYTLYAGIFLGLTVHFLWIWNIDDKFVHSIYSTSDVHIEATSPIVKNGTSNALQYSTFVDY